MQRQKAMSIALAFTAEQLTVNAIIEDAVE